MKLDKREFSDSPACGKGSKCPRLKRHSTWTAGNAEADRPDAEHRHRPCEELPEWLPADGMAHWPPRIRQWQWQCPFLQQAQQEQADMLFPPVRTCTIAGLPHAPSERSSNKACSRFRINFYFIRSKENRPARAAPDGPETPPYNSENSANERGRIAVQRPGNTYCGRRTTSPVPIR